uniref:Uncharacterized protein n=1 Tax=Meloidogyne enterolobii TaxID=390850 RepID=A0A6V7XWG2_MELEN|nr:unnamed protein product [Meloidogyne enterolobii]
MANKFILVPEDIYRGLLTQPSSDTGNINLDYTRKNLDIIKRQHENNELKNINYNQELRRYLHMLKEQNQTPAGVAVRQIDNPALDQIKQLLPLITPTQNENAVDLNITKPSINDEEKEVTEESMYTADEGSDVETPKTSKTPKSKLTQRTSIIYHFMKKNFEKYNVNKEDKILNEKGTKEILGSNVKKSLDCIIRSDFTGKNKWHGVSPPGTTILEKRLRNDPYIWQLIEKAKTPITPRRITQPKRISQGFKSKQSSLFEGEWRPPKEWI